MDDRPRPVVVLDMSQAKVLSAFDQEDRALPALLVEIPENSQPAAAGILSQSSRQISQVRRKYGPQVPLVGGLPPTGLQLEPFGETTFLEMISIYLSQATALKAAGCEVILIHSLPTLAEARAALLGARATGLPVWITVALHHSGEELSEGDTYPLLIQAASGTGEWQVNLIEQTPPRYDLREGEQVTFSLTLTDNRGRTVTVSEYFFMEDGAVRLERTD